MELADAREPAEQTYEIRDLVEDAIDRYFDVLLPGFIDADFRGNGYEMLWRMLEAHDRRELIRSSTPVSPRARALAAKVRRACPPRISGALPFENGQVILGRFTLEARQVGTAVRSRRGVEIYPRALLLCGATTLDALRAEIELTIFHEYIHYFESFLLRREQPLAGRERGIQVPALGYDEARRLDRRHARRRLAFWISAAVLGIGVLVAVVSWQRSEHPDPPPAHVMSAAERDKQRADAEAYEAQLATEHARLAELDRALLANLDTIVARDLDPQAAVALIGSNPAVAFAPGHDSPVVSQSDLEVDRAMPGVPLGVPDVAITYLWLHDRDSDPARLIGIAWSATTGHPTRVAATVHR